MTRSKEAFEMHPKSFERFQSIDRAKIARNPIHRSTEER
jgi:hypothetical protein